MRALVGGAWRWATARAAVRALRRRVGVPAVRLELGDTAATIDGWVRRGWDGAAAGERLRALCLPRPARAVVARAALGPWLVGRATAAEMSLEGASGATSARASSGAETASASSSLLDRATAGAGGAGAVEAAPDVDAWWLAGVWVHRALRGGGLGARLVTTLATRAAAAGRSSLWLHVAADNVAAQQLYRKLGFREVASPRLAAWIAVEHARRGGDGAAQRIYVLPFPPSSGAAPDPSAPARASLAPAASAAPAARRPRGRA